MAKTKTTALKTAKATLIPPPREINVITAPMQNPDGIRPTYTNNAACMITPHEFRIIFSELVVSSPSDLPEVQLRANVAMAPTQFKALAKAVQTTLEQFEKQFGEISWPPKK